MQNEIYEIFSRLMEVPVADVNKDMTPDTVPNWDSLRHMKLVLELESRFNIDIPPENIMDMVSVEAILKAVNDLAAR